ncbi:MAG: hypothetical protein HZB16_03355 [Armatimonadetes bacterium]|nr:hypothetical protein [Armatimonadota bacterium]
MPRPYQEHLRRAPTICGRQAVLASVTVAPAAALIALLTTPQAFVFIWLTLFLGWQLQFGILAGNRALRNAVAERLASFGHAVETGHDRFVGLAYPCYFGHERRAVETDDDVGFLTVDARGLVFLGDGLDFVVPAEQIADVRLVRDANTFFLSNRVEVETRDGEPQDTIVFDSRDHAAHSACNRDNRRLASEIRAIMPRAQRARLTATAEATLAEDDCVTSTR